MCLYGSLAAVPARAQEQTRYENGDPISPVPAKYASPDAQKTTLTSPRLSQATQALTARFGGVSTRVNLFEESCLFTYAIVDVSDDGQPVTGLTESDFTVLEEGQSPEFFFVQQGGQGGGTAQADIVFIVDNSRSIGNEQAAITANFADFVDALNASSIDFQLGLTRYGQSDTGGNPRTENNGVLISDGIAFRDDIFSRNITSGGTEPAYDAIQLSTQGFNFRPGAQKVFVLITDENLDQGSVTEEQALQALQDEGGALYAVVPGNLENQARALTDPTGGRIFDITSNFNDILNDLVTAISARYIVGLRPQQEFNGAVERSLEITVNAPAGSATISTTYVPGRLPQGMGFMDGALVGIPPPPGSDLPFTPPAAGQDITLLLEVEDVFGPDVTQGQLFYRTTGNLPYQSVPLEESNLAGTEFQATIPAADVQAPGIDYYFSFTDGVNVATSPAEDPEADPFQIGIENAPPFIASATEVTELPPGIPLPLAFDIRDDGTLAETVLFFRQQGALNYQSLPLLSTGGNDYEATIPGEEVTDRGLEYYVRVVDNQGVGGFFGANGTPDFPVVLGGCQPLEDDGDDDGDDDGPVADTTPPVCSDPELTRNDQGIVDGVEVTAVDAESGIANIEFTKTLNNLGFVDGDGPFEAGDVLTFAEPTLQTLLVRGERIEVGERAQFEFIATNAAGLSTTCDPVMLTVSGSGEVAFSLKSPYPNPTAQGARLAFSLDEPGETVLEIYDLQGRLVATLLEETLARGSYEALWDGRTEQGAKLPSGMYFALLKHGTQTATRAITIVR